MGKRKKIWKNDSQNSYKRPIIKKFSEEDMDDEIDAFHKKNDVIPLLQDDDLLESDDDDDEIPVFNYKDIDGDEADEDDEADENENDDEYDEGNEIDDIENNTDNNDVRNGHEFAKWKRVEKLMRVRVGGVDDEMDDEDDEDDDQKIPSWGGKKYLHGADTVDFEIQSSDDEAAAMEEDEILRMQRERTKHMSMEDFGLYEEVDVVEEPLMARDNMVKSSVGREDDDDDTELVNEVVRKDLDDLSKDEQMDVLYSFAPELVVLLPSLNESLQQLETTIIPLLNKIKGRPGGDTKKGGVNFVEVKKMLYQVYCQTIVFYLLLKSEGLPVRNHPVIARLVQLKGLLNKLHQFEESLPSELGSLLRGEVNGGTISGPVNIVSPLDLGDHDRRASHIPPETRKSRKAVKNGPPVTPKSPKAAKGEGKKSKREKDRLGAESREMLQFRAALEKKLEKDGVSASVLKPQRRESQQEFISEKLETVDDFDDEVAEGGRQKRVRSSSRPTTLFELVTSKQKNRDLRQVASGDADVAPRDDIGERRRKYEMHILARAGVGSQEGRPDSGDEGDEPEGEIVKNKKAENLLPDLDIPPRAAPCPSETVDGKRHISRQMETNRGLTRFRNKGGKNPRKKYRSKHEKAVFRRKGQVREVRKLAGSYGGEPTGINATISRSVRFNH